MNDNCAVDTVRDSLTTARDSLTEVHMTTPLDTIVRHGRARSRRHRLTGLAGAAVVAVGAVLAVTALLPASHPASHQPRVQLAAWTVTRQPGGIIHVTIRELRDPAGLQAELRADGVPASVSFGNGQQTACRPYPGGGFTTSANPALINSVFPSGGGHREHPPLGPAKRHRRAARLPPALAARRASHGNRGSRGAGQPAVHR